MGVIMSRSEPSAGIETIGIVLMTGMATTTAGKHPSLKGQGFPGNERNALSQISKDIPTHQQTNRQKKGKTMKKGVCTALIILATLSFMHSGATAAECSGAWRVLPHYNPGYGGACASLGLNTHQAVCQPGQRYATYCDDASGGRYRVCQSNVPCSRERHRGSGYGGGFTENSENARGDQWEFWDGRREDRYDRREDRRDDRYDRREDRRDDRYDRREDRGGRSHGDRPYPVFDCTQWDYQANRPCPPGTVNRDCRNHCGGR